jgi:hypothetical protein
LVVVWNFCESVGEEGGFASSTVDVLEELRRVSSGFVAFIWLCRLVKGGVGGLLVRPGNEVPSLWLSLWTAEDGSTDGGGGGGGANGLLEVLVVPVLGPWPRSVATAAEGGASVPTLVVAAFMEGLASVSFLPCLVRGTDGFCRACGATGLNKLRLSIRASSKSSSCDVRGVSVERLVMGSKMDSKMD